LETGGDGILLAFASPIVFVTCGIDGADDDANTPPEVGDTPKVIDDEGISIELEDPMDPVDRDVPKNGRESNGAELMLAMSLLMS